MYGYAMIGFVLLVAGFQAVAMLGTLSHSFGEVFNIISVIK
jgi:hypothetical protein